MNEKPARPSILHVVLLSLLIILITDAVVLIGLVRMSGELPVADVLPKIIVFDLFMAAVFWYTVRRQWKSAEGL